MQLNRLLFATDLSDNSRAAEAWAITLAKSSGAELAIAHCVEIASFAYGLPEGGGPAVIDQLEAAGKIRLGELVDLLAKRHDKVSGHLLTGSPWRSLLEVAKETEAELIVQGTRGLTGLPHVVLGSTAQRVLQHAECPVLTVPSIGTFTPPPPIRTVVIGTDFSEPARRATERAIELLSDEGTRRLILVNTYATPLVWTSYGGIPTANQYLDEFKQNAEEQLATAAAAIGGGIEVETVAIEGYPSHAIVEQGQKHEADLIALGTHGRSGLPHLVLGSTAERVVQTADRPVLTVRK